MTEIKTGDEVEVFGQRGHVNRIEAIAGEIVRIEVQHIGVPKPLWQGWFVPDLLTLIAPPAPEPQVGEVWAHVSGEDKLFFYSMDGAVMCIDTLGYRQLWDHIRAPHYYSKVEA